MFVQPDFIAPLYRGKPQMWTQHPININSYYFKKFMGYTPITYLSAIFKKKKKKNRVNCKFKLS